MAVMAAGFLDPLERGGGNKKYISIKLIYNI
jgi:hypothetical protein